MKTLIIGTGVIGTIYGWALSESGVDITHLVRKGRKQEYLKGIGLGIMIQEGGIILKMSYKNSNLDEARSKLRSYFTETIWGRRSTEQSHLNTNPRDMKLIFWDVYNTGKN